LSSLIPFLHFLAQTSPAAPPATQSSAPPWAQLLSGPMFPVLLLLLVAFLFMSGNKRKEERKRTDMLSQLKRGDEIQTIGGIIGKVIEPREDRVLVKVDESSNTKIWFSRNAIHRVLTQDTKTETKS
jgi:preprotein translocase subunit YajC